MKIAGTILLIIGLGLSIFTAFTFFTKEKVVDIGSIEISTSKPHNLTWSPLIGIGVMVIGGFILLRANKKE
jgi:hypothetical protein